MNKNWSLEYVPFQNQLCKHYESVSVLHLTYNNLGPDAARAVSGLMKAGEPSIHTKVVPVHCVNVVRGCENRRVEVVYQYTMVTLNIRV